MKKESLSASMPKLIMTVSLIVCMGAVLGAVGYLAKNKLKITLPIMPPIQEEKVTISTDKTEYEQGENIKWMILNNGANKLFLVKDWCGSISGGNVYTSGPFLEYINENIWEDLQWYVLPHSICNVPSSECIEVQDGFNDILKTKYTKYGDTSIKMLEEGTYRIKITLGNSCKQSLLGKRGTLEKTFIAYSNEFTIKQKEKNDETADLSSNALATEDWKTYRNEKYGFEVKYPLNIKEKNIKISPYSIKFYHIKDKEESEIPSFTLEITKDDIADTKLSPLDWVKNRGVKGGPCFLNRDEYEETIIGEAKVILVKSVHCAWQTETGPFRGDFHSNLSYLYKNSIVYILELWSVENPKYPESWTPGYLYVYEENQAISKEEKELKEIFDQILSTFKFTEK